MKEKISLLILSLAFLLIPNIVKADNEEYYINQQGVIFDEDNYNNLSEVLGSHYVEFMTQNEYDGLKNQTLTLVAQDEVAMDLVEANGIPVDLISPSAVSGNPGGYVTASKKLTLLVYILQNGEYYATASNEWTKMPSVRVYDVFAMRVDTGFTVIDGSQQGTQSYASPSDIGAVTYQYNGTNTMRFSNGFGMSMNLVDDTTIDTLINTITARLSGTKGDVQASYQHCTNRYVTRSQSMNYFLNVNGLGGAVMFNDSNLFDKYDGMMGVYTRINK